MLQRYAKVPTFEEIEGRENVGVAFDHLSVNPRTLSMLQHVYEPLKIIFQKEIQQTKDNTEHRMAARKAFSDNLATNVLS